MNIQLYLETNNINGALESLGCTGLTEDDIKELELEIESDDDNMISTQNCLLTASVIGRLDTGAVPVTSTISTR